MTIYEIKVKDIYDKVRAGEISKYHFMVWLRFYGHKYKIKGWEEMEKIAERTNE